MRYRITLVALIGLIGGWWFYFKLGYSTLHIPGNGDIFMGAWYIPFFVLVMMATYGGGVIDGLDGLAGGAFATITGSDFLYITRNMNRELSRGPNDPTAGHTSMGSWHPGVCHFLMVDASVQAISNSTSIYVLGALADRRDEQIFELPF